MSARNFFIIKYSEVNNLISLKNTEVELVNLAKSRNIGIHFNIIGYHDELINLLNTKHDYFCISESFSQVECDDLFDATDSYQYVINLKLNRKQKEMEAKKFLINKFKFLNEIINILFKNLPNIRSVDFYISDQYSTTLTDYETMVVVDKDLTKSLVDSYEPGKPKKMNNYFGLKSVKFVIK